MSLQGGHRCVFRLLGYFKGERNVSSRSELRDNPEPAATSGKIQVSATLRALRHRNFQLFFSGQLISLVGTWMQNVAQAWLVYRLTGSSLLLGAAGFASQFPVF